MLSRLLRSSLIVCSALALGCGPTDRTTETVGGDGEGGVDAGGGGGGGGGGGDNPGQAEQCNRMDLLFVIDDSGSMIEEQENLAANFDDFIAVLDAYQTADGQPLDYRVAVTTSGRDLGYTIDEPPITIPGIGTIDPPPIPFSESGDNGQFRQGCGMTRPWIERADGDVSGTFSCVAEVGTGGPSIEMPLLTSRMALEGTINQGFLREDALLALVILTDEDDCSRPDNNFTIESDQCYPEWPGQPPVSEFVAFFDSLTGARGRWATAVIAGPGPGTCSSEFGEAFEARRLKQFVELTGEYAVFSSICEGDLASALGEAIANFTAACDNFPPVD